jgi:hypothetical protein
MPQRRMLLYTPVIQRGIKAGAEIYTITTGGLVTVASAAATSPYTVHSAEWLQATARSVSTKEIILTRCSEAFLSASLARESVRM